MELLLKIWIAYILDLIFGDPQNIIHPVQIIGKLIEILEKILLKSSDYIKVSPKKVIKNIKEVNKTLELNNENNKTNKNIVIIKGGILTFIVVICTYIVCFIISKNTNNIIIAIIEIYLMYTIFSVNSLAREGNKVYNILQKGDIELAKKKLSYLVSRDTEKMDKKMIIRSTMETISENTIDGIIAPMFYMFFGGFSFAMVYKAINTLDSMVGYKNEKYIYFGKISAKLDDIANFIPARIAGILIIVSSFLLKYDYKNSWKIFFRDRKNHSSPNAAHSESSVAGALGIQFGGKVSYFGKEVNKPTIGDKKKEFELEDIKKNIRIMYITSFVGITFFSIVVIVMKII